MINFSKIGCHWHVFVLKFCTRQTNSFDQFIAASVSFVDQFAHLLLNGHIAMNGSKRAIAKIVTIDQVSAKKSHVFPLKILFVLNADLKTVNLFFKWGRQNITPEVNLFVFC
jgi:hypothetical protein